ncbi:MAG TPA: TIGR04255 family protein [Solirubrobacteraceae bacterium]|nr:TIGR04255 family protein [Solirubrobacteraceae bacterium]
MDPQREIYPNAPLKLVAFGLEFPELPELMKPPEALDQRLREHYPLHGPPPVAIVEARSGLQVSPQGGIQTGGLRRIDRRKRNAVVLTRRQLIVETSDYARFEGFRERLAEVLRHIAETVELPAVERIGLRYIDEIDPAELPAPVRWSDYLAEELLAHEHLLDGEPLESSAAILLERGVGEQIVVRSGLARSAIVNPEGPLYIARSPQGACRFIDIDSSWSAPPNDLPEFEPEQVIATVERLHAPIGDAFERIISERLRGHLRAKRELDPETADDR